jgi:hypothetical protein
MQQREFMALLPPFLPTLDPADMKSMLRQMAEGLDLKFSFTEPQIIGEALQTDRLAPGGPGPGGPIGPPGISPAAPAGPGGALVPPGGGGGAVAIPGGPAPGIQGGPVPATPLPRLDGRSTSQMRH